MMTDNHTCAFSPSGIPHRGEEGDLGDRSIFSKLPGAVRFICYLFLTALAAFIFSLAFPGKFIADGLPFLSFFSLVPVFWITYTSPYRTVWFYGLEYGFLFYFLYNYWLSTFHPLAILIAPVLESIQYAVLFSLMRASKNLFKKHYAFGAWLFYNAYLYITQLGFLAYPYGNPSSAVYEYTSLIQMTSITGIWGLAALMTLPQAIVADCITDMKDRRKRKLLLASLIILAFAWICGFFMKSYYDTKESGRTVRVAAVQHSADTWQGGYTTYKANYETLVSLTEEALEAQPDIVVWSETAFVPSVRWHQTYDVNTATRKLVTRFVEFGKSLPVPLITGNPEGVIKDTDKEPVLESGEWNWKTYNTVIFFSDGDVKGTYRKQHLVPFTEYFPYEKEFPHLYELLKANDYKWWEKGDEATVFEYDGIKFSTPICFEDTFGSLSAAFVRNGADMIINLSNDYWSRSLQAERQHFQLAVFRAVENRRPLLRSTNSGITALVLPSGEIVNELLPFEKCWGIYEIPLYQKKGETFYTRHPDFFGRLFVAFSVILSLYAVSLSLHEKITMKKEREEYLAHMFENMTQ